ncbi:HNH endonuclease [Neobacillus sp. LXY-1]|uniref:HNH endonuclease n=1 Tax=Neobacillus sp. LXY-1 TaxID=3379133 RepID=UPI003EDFC9EB
MTFNPNLKLGQTLNNNQISEVFKCSTQGGMRRSHATNTLVIISDHTKLYEDKWIGKIFYYTGMGKKGHQSLTFAQNKTLSESNTNGVAVHLFEVLRPTEYVYTGQVVLAGEPYQEEQFDEDKKLRNVWVFPLELANGKKPIKIPKKLIEVKELEREKLARKLSDEELANRAKHASKKATSRTVTSNNFERNPFVTEYAKRWSKGVCQLCEKPAPFKNRQGEPHLHTHHIEWLSRGGEDSIENTVALCPNCHDRMHILDSPEDIKNLKDKVAKGTKISIY